jgi:tRNA pseudouridine55 synthase
MINLYKPLGLTPLQALQALQQQYPEYSKAKLAYAGRLDPQAEGVMLVLVDNECKQQPEYLQLPKAYTWQLLLGISSDTGDIMGMITADPSSLSSLVLKHQDDIHALVATALAKYTGTFNQAFPAYSAKTVGGQKLFKLVRTNQALKLPVHQVEVYHHEVSAVQQAKLDTMLIDIHKRIKQVSGDFRQTNIIQDWQGLQQQLPNTSAWIVTINSTVSSGTYIRQIAADIGKDLGAGALAYTIKRTAVGNYTIADSIALQA